VFFFQQAAQKWCQCVCVYFRGFLPLIVSLCSKWPSRWPQGVASLRNKYVIIWQRDIKTRLSYLNKKKTWRLKTPRFWAVRPFTLRHFLTFNHNTKNEWSFVVGMYKESNMITHIRYKQNSTKNCPKIVKYTPYRFMSSKIVFALYIKYPHYLDDRQLDKV